MWPSSLQDQVQEDSLPPLAPSTLVRYNAQTLNTNESAAYDKDSYVTAKHGDKLFELDATSSIEILGLLEGYDWPNDDIIDIGLTLDKGAPRLGVLTIRHLKLAMTINHHVRRHLTRYHWSTIAIDTRTVSVGDKKWQQRKLSALMLLGCYSEGHVFAADGTLQVDASMTDTAFANDRPYSSMPPIGGRRYVIELHNDNLSPRALREDLRLLRSVGFNLDGRTPLEWYAVASTPGPCPLRLVPTFYTMLFIELCCGETSELCKLEHTTPACLGIRVTSRHDILNTRTLAM